jgi:hypothetical protein
MMKLRLGKACIIFLLGTASIVLSGCLTGGNVDDPNLVTPNPPPPGGNSAPIILGNPPPAVVVGQNYSFTPVASDPDGDTLVFSIQNPPSWASFEPSTGRLFGLAALGTEGTYANIVISVSDGNQTVNLSQFSIEVTQAALGSATLSWTAPTQNTDGSPLANLAAYKIYYGTTPGSYTNEVLVTNPGTTMYVVDNLVPNTYYFVSTSINAVGTESVFSNMASTTIN